MGMFKGSNRPSNADTRAALRAITDVMKRAAEHTGQALAASKEMMDAFERSDPQEFHAAAKRMQAEMTALKDDLLASAQKATQLLGREG
jgi:hypothetical protein